MGVIKSATYGDSQSNTDVLSSLTKSATSGETTIRVSSSLVPIIDKVSGANTVALTPKEQKLIQDQAVRACGSPNDQACIAKTRRQLEESKLKEKQEEVTQSSIQIAGNYLTVECEDDTGRKRTIKVPDGQEFNMSVCDGSLPQSRTAPLDLKTVTGALPTLYNGLWDASKDSVKMFAYISSILITWMTFRTSGSRFLAYGLTALSAVIPYSGFVLVFVGKALPELYRVIRLRYIRNQEAYRMLAETAKA